MYIIEKMIIVTGASQNHFKSLKQLIESYKSIYGEHGSPSARIIVYNLGINGEDWENFIKDTSSIACIEYKVFPYEKYPDYFNINIEAGQYAWKPAIVYETSLIANGDNIIWMDAGNKIIGPFDILSKYLARFHIHTHVTNGPIKEWTHPKTIEFMHANEFVECRNRNGACIAFNTSTPWVRDLIKDWYTMALTRDCIAPEGSDRSNHRQDQAVFTVLYYYYKKNYRFDDNVGFPHPYICHCDCD